MMNCDEMAETIFNEMDLNRDNKVTEKEFIQVCMKNNTISSMLATNILKIITTDTS